MNIWLVMLFGGLITFGMRFSLIYLFGRFQVPASATTLSLWYRPRCTSTVALDWSSATLTDIVTGVTTIILPPTCANTTTWQQVVSASLSANAGHAVTLSLVNHDDNDPTTANRTRFDDIVVS